MSSNNHKSPTKRPEKSFPRLSSASSVSSVSSSYRHHHSPVFTVKTPTKPQPLLLQDASHAPKTRGSLGILVVGLGGSLGSTLAASVVLAHSPNLEWRGPHGQVRRQTEWPAESETEEAPVPLAKLSLAAIGGWDTRSTKVGDALLQHQILDYDLAQQLRDNLNSKVKVFRAYGEGDHVLQESTTSELLKCLRADIRYFKWRNGVVGHTTVVWCCEVPESLPEFASAIDLLHSMGDTEPLPQPFLLYATAALLEGCSFVVVPQNDIDCVALFELARSQVGVYCYLEGLVSLEECLTDKLQQSVMRSVLHTTEMRSESYSTENHHTVRTTATTAGLSQHVELSASIYMKSEVLWLVPRLLDIIRWCDYFASASWPLDKVQLALQHYYDVYQFSSDRVVETELWLQAKAAAEAKGTSQKKKRVRIRPDEEKATEWAIPHNASIICAGLACVDMQLHHATGGDGGESIETFTGCVSIGGGSVSMACKTLARLVHGAPLDESYLQVTPPVVHSVVPLCKLGHDDAGDKLIQLLQDCGQYCRNVDTKPAVEARKKDAAARTALSVLPIYKDGRRGCFFDAASNATFSSSQLLEMMHSLTHSGGPELDVSQLTEDELDDYRDRVGGAAPVYGAFLFGYPHLLPHLQGQALARIMLEARSMMVDGGITALDLNGVPESRFERSGKLRDVNGLRQDTVIGAALEYVDILHLNEEELQLLTGCEIQNRPDSPLEDDFAIASAISLFHLCGVGLVAVTRGKKGSFVSCNDEQRFSQTKMLPASWVDCTAKIKAFDLPPDTIINTNGAGDSFTAGLLVAAMFRHTGMTVPEEKDTPTPSNGQNMQSLTVSSPAESSTSSPKKRLTPYQLYMRENYVMLKQQCKDDKRAIFSRCHELWENESDEVKAMYERKAQEEEDGEQSPDKSASTSQLVNDFEAVDSTPRSPHKGGDSQDGAKNVYMTNRALNLESAVQFASLVAAHHIDVGTRDLTHLDVARLLERSLIFPEGLEEI